MCSMDWTNEPSFALLANSAVKRKLHRARPKGERERGDQLFFARAVNRLRILIRHSEKARARPHDEPGPFHLHRELVIRRALALQFLERRVVGV